MDESSSSTDAGPGPLKAALQDDMEVDIAATFNAFTDPATFTQPVVEAVSKDSQAVGTRASRISRLSKTEINEQQSRSLVLTNVAISTTRKTLEQTFIILIRQLTGKLITIQRPSAKHDLAALESVEVSAPLINVDTVQFPSIEVVYYRGLDVDDVSTASTSLDKMLMAISGGGSKLSGATKLALVRFTNDTLIDSIITHFSGRIKIDNRHIFMYPGKTGYAELKQPQSIFISGLTDRKMDIELLLTYLETQYKFILTNMRIFKDPETQERKTFCIVELDKSCWPLDSRLWLTEDTIPDTDVTFKIMKCISEKKAQKRKERSIRNEKYRRFREGQNQFSDHRQRGGPAILREMQNKYRARVEQVQQSRDSARSAWGNRRDSRDSRDNRTPIAPMNMRSTRDPSKKPRWTPEQRRMGKNKE